MAIYMSRWFDRWARKQNLDARALCEAVHEMAAGLYKDEEDALKKLASQLLSLPLPALSTAQRAGELMEVNFDAQDQIGNS